MDLTSLLQGGALAALLGMLGAGIWQTVQRQATRQAWRKLRRSRGFRDGVAIVIALAPYLLAGAWLYSQQRALPLVMLAAILAGTVTIKAGHRRWRVFHLVLLAILAAGFYLVLRTFYAPAVVIGTAVFRDCWAYLRGDR